MRHAVSVASVNAAAVPAGNVGGNGSHVRRRHDDVLRQRAREMLAEHARSAAQSDCSPARQYSHVRSLMPGLTTT